ncbi:hypothetical protein C7999DRAFT_28100 [Corynascus novoguineensis]|uniref:Uncharacterized protein n=1 Tax=Corynascus novoguineensis TaxID=1126955 RepID=A0AAN7CZR5_9PEZI|nr:hypothetical protein C7999DRAFT_28100 [Corynascus novoguineensis]
MPVFVISITSTAIGTCVLSVLGYYLFLLRRKALRREHAKKKQDTTALDRVVVSSNAEKKPTSQGPPAPEGQQGAQPAMPLPVDPEPRPQNILDTDENSQPAMTPATHTVGSPRSHPEPSLSSVGRGRPRRGTETSLAEATYAVSARRRTASSHFMDSTERVYACILASPLEHVKAGPSTRQEEEPPPAAREDVGWPLPSSWI